MTLRPLHEETLAILGIALVHTYWGVLLLFSDAPMKATAIAGLARHIPEHWLLGFALLVASLAAILATQCEPSQGTLMCLMPQQMVLIGSAVAVIRASARERYADGTIVAGGWLHISTDQAVIVMLAFLHIFAVLLFHGYLRRWTRA